MHILLIEDDDGDIEFIENILADYKIDILKEIPEEISKDKYDFIITDYFIQGGKVSSLLENLSHIPDFHVPILITSGKIDEIDVSKIPSQLNALILSKNENFKELLLYYMDLICKREFEHSESLDYKTLFMNLVHDLRNDLGYCENYKELKEYGFESVEDELQILKIVCNSTSFAFSRLEHLSNYLNTGGENYGSILDAFELIKGSQLLKKYENSFEFEGSPSEIVDIIPLYFLSVILKNLLENSCKHAREDTALKIKIGYYNNGTECSVVVEDNSCGMSEETSENLFKKAQKSESGLGIGLVVLNRVITSFGGNVVIASEVGKGTKITIRFKL